MSHLVCLVGVPSPKLQLVQQIAQLLARSAYRKKIVITANDLPTLQRKLPQGDEPDGPCC